MRKKMNRNKNMRKPNAYGLFISICHKCHDYTKSQFPFFIYMGNIYVFIFTTLLSCIFIVGILIDPDHFRPLMGIGFWPVGIMVVSITSVFGSKKIKNYLIANFLSLIVIISFTVLYYGFYNISIFGDYGFREKLVFYVAILVLYFVIVFFSETLGGFIIEFWKMVSDKKIYKAFMNVVIAYFCLSSIFGFIYAFIYLILGESTFTSISKIELFDFFYYSFFLPVSLGYSDLTPLHPAAKALSLLEILSGLSIVVVYMGVIVGKITEFQSDNIKENETRRIRNNNASK